MPDPQHANQSPKPSDDVRVQPLVEQVRQVAHPLTGDWSDFDSLMKLIDDARYVLIGEASHGTHEFYRMRALITRRLIVEQGFSAICAEADWPDAYRINRYVRGRAEPGRVSMRSRASCDFPPGCGAIPLCSISSAGCASTTPTTTPLHARSASMASTSTAYIAR